MRLKRVKGQANLGRLLFSFDLVMLAVAAGAEGNVEIGSIDFQDVGESQSVFCGGSSAHRRFLGPAPQEVNRICSKSFALACCMSLAASVSLRTAATRFSALTLSPGRKYWAGWSSSSKVSSGVR
jgi:hypothetical protein